jgi:hypothetical protein
MAEFILGFGMRHNKNYTRLSDGALERVMREVLNGMQAFSTSINMPTRPQARAGYPTGSSGPSSLPRFTSLRSEELSGSKGETVQPFRPHTPNKPQG